MKDKLISGLIGAIVGVLVIYGYFYITDSGNNELTPQNNSNAEMTDERLEKISERTGLSKDEIQERLDSGETMRDIMGGGGERKLGDRNFKTQ